MKVAIIGLGYVGLNLAALCARKGHETYGVETDPRKLDLLKRGKSYLPEVPSVANITVEDRLDKLPAADVLVICVPTPVTESFHPDLRHLEAAAKACAGVLKKGQMVILESTVNPGVTESVVRPLLEGSTLKAGSDFFLAYCPERIDPGNTKWTIEKIPRVLGAVSDEGRKKAKAFYDTLLEAEVKEMSSIRATEAVKILENTFRDINIAFVNELAQSFARMGIDIEEVIEGATTKPFGFLPFFPGCGVGGHCIPVDPYYLIDDAKKRGFDHHFLRLARKINDGMPGYTVQLTAEALNEIGKSLKGCAVGLLGLSYKKGVGDLRESPALEVMRLLEEAGARVRAYDPYVPERSTGTLPDLLSSSEVLVVLTDHEEFLTCDGGHARIVIDGRNCLDKERIVASGKIYRGIGR